MDTFYIKSILQEIIKYVSILYAWLKFIRLEN